MGQMAAIFVKELKVLWRDRQALVLLFLMPGFFILVMSVALEGVFEAGTRDRPVEVLLVNRDRGDMGERTLSDLRRVEGLALVEQYRGVPLTPEQAEGLIRNGRYRLGLVFPEGYTEGILGGRERSSASTSGVSFLVDPTVNRQLLAGIAGAVQSALERSRMKAQMSSGLRSAKDGSEGTAQVWDECVGTLTRVLGDRIAVDESPSDRSPGVTLEIVSPRGLGKERRPSATEQNVPAYAIFGVFFIVLTLAKSFVRERTEGTFVRLLCAPLAKVTLLAGKLLSYYLVNLLQIAVMFAVGVVVFGMRIGNVPALIVVSVALAAAANGLGLLVASLGRTEAQVDTLSVLLALSLASLGGMMVPTFVMPKALQTLSLFTPHAWALAGYQDAIVRELGVADVLKEAGVLLGFAGAFFAVALWRLRLA